MGVWLAGWVDVPEISGSSRKKDPKEAEMGHMAVFLYFSNGLRALHHDGPFVGNISWHLWQNQVFESVWCWTLRKMSGILNPSCRYFFFV